MSKEPDPTPPEDPNLAAFKAALAKKKAAQQGKPGLGHGASKGKPQKPRPKDRIRRRP